VEELRKAPIADPIPYLFLDVTFLDARWARKVENVPALVAYGIGLDGHRQLLAVTTGAEESEESRSDLLAQLIARGLAGVQLVVADAHAGIAKAVRRHLPEVPAPQRHHRDRGRLLAPGHRGREEGPREDAAHRRRGARPGDARLPPGPTAGHESCGGFCGEITDRKVEGPDLGAKTLEDQSLQLVGETGFEQRRTVNYN
jgi:Transposase, Mutator family